jgi:hypothetical protein
MAMSVAEKPGMEELMRRMREFAESAIRTLLSCRGHGYTIWVPERLARVAGPPSPL